MSMAGTPEYILRYFAPMQRFGEPYRQELSRRLKSNCPEIPDSCPTLELQHLTHEAEAPAE